MAAEKGEITVLLARLAAGDRTAEEALMQQVYLELHHLATVRLRQERAGHTLQPTALVHEAYLRLVGASQINCSDRAHFFRLISCSMRNILVDYGRRRSANRRGNAAPHLPLDDEILNLQGKGFLEAIEIAELLSQFAAISPRQASIVEMRYFGGLSNDEIAEALGIDKRTVSRDWAMAQAWLHKQSRRQKDAGTSGK